jgi:hypothetical protein
MLWQYRLKAGFFEAPSNVAEARKILIERIKADPADLVSWLAPTEPTVKTLADVVKRVITG